MTNLRAYLVILGLLLLAGSALCTGNRAADAPLSTVDIVSHVSFVDGAAIHARPGFDPIVELDEGESAQQALDGLSRSFLWAVPGGTDSVSVELQSVLWTSVSTDDLPDSIRTIALRNPQPLISSSRISSMRGMGLASICINALQPEPDGNGLRWAGDIELLIHYHGGLSGSDSRKASRSFRDMARGMASNLDDVVPEPELRPESYLIVTHPNYANQLSAFVNWKRARGHTVTLVTTAETGTTNQQIKNYIQNAYDNWGEPPVFVLLVGDVDAPTPVPTWLVPGFYHAFIATDHNYALLEGTDYFPDVFIGRFSVDQASELQTVINKCIGYERTPYEPTGTWRRRILITGVRNNPAYNSAWPTLRWIGRQCVEAGGYDQAIEVPCPPGSASQIEQAIDNGVSFVAYRGYGSPGDWNCPAYTVQNISALNNGSMLPVITSIVCGGGAFESDVDPCFGEAWLRAGTPSIPKGAIGFIGPSELDTKTRWNNTNVAGIYEGILFEDVQTLGAAMLRGKLELYREFPRNINNYEANSEVSVPFYFYCYNLLGDPGLTFFVGNVRDLSAQIPATVPLGTPAITLSVSDEGELLPDVWGTVMAGDSVISRAISDASGQITLALPQAEIDTVTITLSKPRHEPQISSLAFTTSANGVAAHTTQVIDDGRHGSTGNGDGLVNPGETLAFGIRLRNYGTQSYSGGTLSASAENAGIVLITSSAAIPALAPGSLTDTLWFTATVESDVTDAGTCRIEWATSPGTMTWQTETEFVAPALQVNAVLTNGSEGYPIPNATDTVVFRISNVGHAAQPAFTGTFRSENSELTAFDSLAAYPVIPPGGTALPTDNGFVVHVGNISIGESVTTRFYVSSPGRTDLIEYSLQTGNITEGDPTAPDAYGYRAYQTNDVAYVEAPAYAWVEIDPSQGGPGTVLSLPDNDLGRDTTRTVPLPFAFNFYGQSYTQISICSNGFIAMGQTRESFFRNYSLPAIASPDQMICAFWDDLRVPSSAHVCTYHDEQGGRFIVEWSNLINSYNLTSLETFQVMLYDTSCWPTRTGDGDILIQYNSIANSDQWDNYSTVGIQDRDQNAALQIAYSGFNSLGASNPQSGESILFTTGRPDAGPYFAFSGVVVDDDNVGGSSGNGDGIAQNGETIELQIRLLNTGGSAAAASDGVIHASDNMALLLDSLISVPAVGPGETAVTSSVRMQIAPQVDHNHVVILNLSLSGDAAPCVLLPSLRLAAPVLYPVTPGFDDDAAPPSNGNANGELNRNEIVELFPRLSNFGGNVAAGVHATVRSLDARAAILDSSATIGDVLPDSTATTSDALVFRVMPQTQAGQTVRLRFAYFDADGRVVESTLNYPVVAPRIRLVGLRVTDDTPGGDGDGRLEPGEDVSLFPRVTNIGQGTATGIVMLLLSLDSNFVLIDSSCAPDTVLPGTIREPEIPIQASIALTGIAPRTTSFSVRITGNDGIDTTQMSYLVIGDVQFFEDCETPLNTWSVFGTYGAWHRQSAESNSPTHAFACGTMGEYPSGADEYLRSPTFDFSGTGTLIYHTHYDLGDAGDQCIVQIQSGPTSYHLLEQFTGQSGGWQEHRLPLAGLPSSAETQIRFRFTSNFSGSGQGWFVDDVILLDDEVQASIPHNTAQPLQFSLRAAYPNPFNDRTTIEYAVPIAGHVRLTLYSIEGRVVTTLMDEHCDAGTYRLSWRPLALASGIYFVSLDTQDIHILRKLVYLK